MQLVVALLLLGAGGTDRRVGATTAAPGDDAFQTGYAHAAPIPGGGSVLVYECARRGDGASDVCAMRFSPSGARLDDSGLILSNPGTIAWDPWVSCTATRCLASWLSVGEGHVGCSLDPVTGTYTPPRLMLPAPPPGNGMTSVSTPASNNFLVIASGGAVLRSVLAGPLGTPVGSVQTIATNGAGTIRFPSLAAQTVGSTSLACWQSDTTAAGNLQCETLDGLGMPTHTPLSLGAITAGLGRRVHASLVDGTTFVVAFQSATGALEYARIDATGALAGSVTALGVTASGPPDLALDAAASDVVVAWLEGGDTAMLGRIPAGTASFDVPPQSVATQPRTDALTLALRSLYTVTLESRAHTFATMTAVRVTPFADGGFTSVAPVDLVRGPSSEWSPTATWTGTDWATAWVTLGSDTSTLWVRGSSADGTPLGNPMALTDGGTFPWSPVVGFSGSRFVLWVDADAEDLWFTRFDSGGGLFGSVNIFSSNGLPQTAVAQVGAQVFAVYSGHPSAASWGVYSAVVPSSGLGTLPALHLYSMPDVITHVAAAGSSTQLLVAATTDTQLNWGPANSIAVRRPARLSAASDGTDFVLVWNEATQVDTLLALRIGADGGPLDPAPLVVMADNLRDAEESSRGAVSFDGVAYRIAWEQVTDGGIDLFSARLFPDGTREATQELSVIDPNDEQVSLAAGTPGRTLVTFRRYDPADLAMHAYQRVWADVRVGDPCVSDAECSAGGGCSLGRCAAPVDGGVDAGAVDGGAADSGVADAGQSPPDGGSPPPAPSARSLGVACGCAEVPGAVWLALLTFWNLRVTGRRRGSSRR